MSASVRLLAGLFVVATVMLMAPAASALSPGVTAHTFVPGASSAGSPAAAIGTPSGASSVWSSSIQRMSNALAQDHVPSQERLLPNANPDVSVRNGLISPSYGTPSYPNGVGYYGVQDVHGKNVGTITYYQSVEGSLTLNGLNLLYLQSAGPDEFTAQLNSVLVGVTVHDTPNLQFWTQNVIYYYQSTHTLHLADAIVNFSSPATLSTANTFIGGNGYFAPGFGYFYPEGPTLTVPEPFTITFIMTPAVLNNMPAVFFNYSIQESHGVTIAGSYDHVEFNATDTGVATSPEPKPTYQVDGQAVGGTGFIPNDVELMLGGDGGGSPASIFNINGAMTLGIESNGSKVYGPVPSAYNFGSETGETSEGIAEWASGGTHPVVNLGPGPSIESPLWGVVGAPPFGHLTATFSIDPTNAFAFASPGSTFDENTAAWGPVPANGIATYELPRGMYTFQFLLSEYNPVTITIHGYTTRVVGLSSNPSLGVYTPLWAWNNHQLASISQPGGKGTVSNPYILDNIPSAIDPIFGQFNDYEFPVFPGIQLVDTTDYVAVYDAPAFAVAYTLPWELAWIGNVLPLGDNLAMNFYAVEHVSIVNTPLITGWFFYANYATANVVFWNSSYNLIANNEFYVDSLAMIFYGGTGNTLWGNIFLPTVPAAANPGLILNWGNPETLWLYESGDLIFNNAFATPQTAVTPPSNLYTFNYVPESWVDTWNVTLQPASTVFLVDGWQLSGSVLGLSYVGGNYWSNYGTAQNPYGVLPYNNGGGITNGGDYLPLVPFALYGITFTETGLKAGTSWTVTINGYTQTSTTSSMTFYEPNGTYAFVVGTVSGYTASPAIGAVIVHGANVAVSITWSK